MNPETRPGLEQLFKSIQTFDTIQMSADSREKMYRYHDALMQSIYSILDDQEADNQTKMKYLDDTLSQYAAAMKALFPKIITTGPDNVTANPVIKADQFDVIEEVQKFNPYHDEMGRFSNADSFDQFTITTRDPNKQHWADAAIAREKQREADGLVPGPAPKAKPKESTEPNLPAPEATKTKTNLSEKTLATCREVEAKTVNRKTEKMTLVSDNGEVILEKSGGKGSVSFGGYETAHMGPTVTLTHNHPGAFGGTFSGADVNILTKFDLRAIRAVGKEGTYSLERTSQTMGLKSSTFNKEYAQQSNKVVRNLKAEHKKLKTKVENGEMSVDAANKQIAEYRNDQCNTLHTWLTQNANSYGYNYVFEPSSGGIGKMFEIEKEDAEETTGEFMLDGEFINGDNWMIKEDK